MKPTNIAVDDYLLTLGDKRRAEAQLLIDLIKPIADSSPVMWGPSIIGFGSKHYKYDTGREGDMSVIGFSPRKASITIYFTEGFDRYGDLLKKLGKHKASVSCLYINNLKDIDIDVLRQMLIKSHELSASPQAKPSTVKEYVDSVPAAAKKQFNQLRSIVSATLPNATEVISYGIIGYKIGDGRAKIYISAWKDHTAIYPVPKQKTLIDELAVYIKGKGTLWFPLDKPLPKKLIERVAKALAG